MRDLLSAVFGTFCQWASARRSARYIRGALQHAPLSSLLRGGSSAACFPLHLYDTRSAPTLRPRCLSPGLVDLEADLLDRGFALTPALHAALAWLRPAGLADAGKRLVGHIDAELGAGRTHMPL